MAETLRRILWLFPVLGIGSLVLFALLAAGLPTEPARANLPLFFNPEPRGTREHVAELLDELAAGPSSESAERLARLGGAALPYVLPRLGELQPDSQRRVALALAPVARRTGVARDESVLDDPEASVRFWLRFWQERSLDFQPTVVSRLVRRITTHSGALGSTDLIQLDTYALGELVAQLGAIRTEADVTRARRLLHVVGEITERRWLIEPEATVQQARRAVTECRRWWDERRHLYSDFTGLNRLTATLVQTRYGTWALRTLREATWLDASWIGEQLWRGLRVSGPLLLSCLLGAWIFGALGAALSLRLRLRGSERLVRLGAAAAVPLFLPALVLWPPQAWLGRALGTACFVSLLLGALPAMYVARRSVEDLDAKAPFPSLLRSALRGAPLWAPLVLSESLTLVFALEWTSGLGGLGPRTIDALRRGDVPWLMAACLSLGTLIALVHIAADAALGRTLHRVKTEGSEPC